MLDYDRYEALTFDCYGTLIDWETGILSALRPVLRRASLRPGDEELLEAYAALETRVESGPYTCYKNVLAAVLEGIGGRFGFTPSASELEAFSRSVRSWPPFEDSPEALRLLKKKYRLAILSNIDNDLFAHSALKLGVGFDFVFTAEDIGSYKPARANFEHALARLPVPADRVLHVAQSAYHDIGPAAKMGLRTVWINRRRGRGGGATPRAEARPDAEYPDLISFAEAACGGQ